MQFKDNSTLSIKFNSCSVEDTIKIAHKIALMLREIHKDKKERKIHPSGHKVIRVSVDAEPDTGKTTLLENILYYLTDGDEHIKEIYDYNGMKINFKDGGNSLAWSEYICLERNEHHRTMDSLLGGDFPATSEQHKHPPLPEREANGFDFIEHSFRVPTELLDYKISITKKDKTTREISFAFENLNTKDIKAIQQMALAP